MKSLGKLWRVEVTWEDTTSPGGTWQKYEAVMEMRSRVECMTVGFVLADDSKGMVISSTIAPGNREVGGTFIIPRGAIRKMRRLK